MLFPTADTLPAVRRIENALSGRRLMLVVNPQWQVEGQVISGVCIRALAAWVEESVAIWLAWRKSAPKRR